MSQWSLAKPALVMATIVVVISYAIIMYVMPVSYREFKERQFVLRSDHSALLLEEGTFNTLTEGVTVYIRGREGSTLNGILRARRPGTGTADHDDGRAGHSGADR